jgi:predicted dehydrogenase
MDKLKIGVIGCGNISSIYFKNCRRFKNVEVAACADLIMERARASAREFKIPRACTVKDLLADKSIKIVLNLTIPRAHAKVNEQILRAGKHVYVEKPLGLSKKEAKKTLQLARRKKLFVGCAPDTVLGGGIQTCRKLIDDGVIGRPIGATAFMMCHGHEGWHPDPEFYYEKGGGPMFDMGPYYLTALVTLLGPVRKLSGTAAASFPHRTITSKKKYGKRIKVEVPTHVTGTMEFKNGAVGNIITSFDVWAHKMPWIEIYGSKGTLRVPDPNIFGGRPEVSMGKTRIWKPVKLTHGFQRNSRGIGLSDLARAVMNRNKTFRANSDVAFHVLDIMECLHVSSRTGRHIRPSSTCKRPDPMPRIKPKKEVVWYK